MSSDERISLPASALISFKRELKKLEQSLGEAEEVVVQAAAIRGTTNGLLALTNERILFIADSILSKRFEEIPLEAIEGSKAGSGIRRGELELIAGTEKVRFVAIAPPDRAEAFVEYLHARGRFRELAESQPIPLFDDDPGELPDPPPATADTARPDTERLEDMLAQLHAAGLLSDEELREKHMRLAELIRGRQEGPDGD